MPPSIVILKADSLPSSSTPSLYSTLMPFSRRGHLSADLILDQCANSLSPPEDGLIKPKPRLLQ